MSHRLLFAAAGLALSTAASHAAEPTPYVLPDWQSACGVHGPGFKALPGSDSCIRLGGRVTMAVDAGAGRGTATRTGMGAMGQVEADVRTHTEAGPLRAFVRLRAGGGTGTAPLTR